MPSAGLELTTPRLRVTWSIDWTSQESQAYSFLAFFILIVKLSYSKVTRFHNHHQGIEVKEGIGSVGLSTTFTHFIYKLTSQRVCPPDTPPPPPVRSPWAFPVPHTLGPLVLLSSHEQQLVQNTAHCDDDEASWCDLLSVLKDCLV